LIPKEEICDITIFGDLLNTHTYQILKSILYLRFRSLSLKEAKYRIYVFTYNLYSKVCFYFYLFLKIYDYYLRYINVIIQVLNNFLK